MLAMIASTVIVSLALVFAGGAWHVAHPVLGFGMAGLGCGWLGIVYGYLTTVKGEHDGIQ